MGSRQLLVAAAFIALAFVHPGTVTAAGPNAVMTPAGYNTNAVARADDTSNLVVNLPFSMRWAGTTYTQIYLNMNGNVTFGNTFTDYNPNPALGTVNRAIMAPFWADVDTRDTTTGQMTYSNITSGSVPTVNGRKAFLVNWINVARYNQTTTPLDSFQLVIVDRSDTGAGNFDFMFNYDQITWDYPTASSSRRARAGWGRTDGTSFELPGSGTAQGSTSTLLDTSAAGTSLIQNSLDSGGQLGRYVWQVRAGLAPNSPPEITITNRTLEGNVPNGYVGYNGAVDATATDPEGGAVTFTVAPSFPTTLPLGTSTFRWLASDRGYPVPTAGNIATSTATQTVIVTDTTPPTLPTLSSPTHVAGAWSALATITVNWAGSTDVCTGLNGYSYVWSQNATALPDATRDTTASTLSAAPGNGVWYFNIRSVDVAGNWSVVATSSGPYRIDRVAPTTTDDAPPGWATVSTVTVTLTATDSAGIVAYTRYKLDAGAVATYSAPVAIAAEGTHTLQYFSADLAGNVESTRSALVRIDRTPPTVPGSPAAAALSTTSIEVSFTSSTDAVSGLSYYRIYRGGSLVATTGAGPYVDTGLTPGQSYAYSISAVDVAGNASAQTAAVTESVPLSVMSLAVSAPTVDFGALLPAFSSTITSATTVSVLGIGNLTCDLSCAAADFSNIATPSATPTMPIGALSFATSGYKTIATQAFTVAPLPIDSSAGAKYRWRHDYIFDYTMLVPWTSAPGTYTTTIVYTAVAN